MNVVRLSWYSNYISARSEPFKFETVDIWLAALATHSGCSSWVPTTEAICVSGNVGMWLCGCKSDQAGRHDAAPCSATSAVS
jgi:hypothetical protein